MSLTDPRQLTPEYLTKLLYQTSHLTDGAVSAIEILEKRETNVSATYHLKITYTDKSPQAPAKLFLKIPSIEFNYHEREIEFYQQIAPAMEAEIPADELPFVYCYEVVYDEASGRSHLLLENLANTHFSFDERAPSAIHYEFTLESFAQIHAFWWNNPELGKSVGTFLTKADIQDYIQTTQQKVRDFLAFRSKALDSQHKKILEMTAQKWIPSRLERVTTGRDLTIVHRDPHPLNFLHPRDLEEHTAKIVDWQSWRVDVATDDLAYMMAVHWTHYQREQLEENFLRYYHECLTDFGVDYSWDALWLDYRESVIRAVFILIAAWSDDKWESGWWWQKLSSALEAFTDLNCEDLF